MRVRRVRGLVDVVDLPHSDHGPRSAMAIVLLHGFPLDHRMWRYQKQALESAGYRAVIPDLRGAGKAPMGRGPASMREYGGDVLRMLDRAGVQRFVVAGFSMGGYVALEVARQAGAKVAGLALIDTRAEADSDDARAARAATSEKVRAAGSTQPLVDAMLPKMLTPAAPTQLRAEVEQMMLAQPPEGAMLALAAMASRPDSRPTLQALRIPTLILVGAEDAITPPEMSQAMAALVPGAKCEVIPGAAHLAPMEQSDAVNDALVQWLRGIR